MSTCIERENLDHFVVMKTEMRVIYQYDWGCQEVPAGKLPNPGGSMNSLALTASGRNELP